MSRLRRNLSYANVMATIAVFVALGGTATAALVITGQNVKDASLSGKDVRNASLTTSDIKNGSLLKADFRAGQLPAGPQGSSGAVGPAGAPGAAGAAGPAGTGTATKGPQGLPGDTGATGPQGETGTVDTSNFYTKGQSDGRFVAGTAVSGRGIIPDGDIVRNDTEAVVTLPGLGAIVILRTSAAECLVRFINTSGGTLFLHGILERDGISVSSAFGAGEPILANGVSVVLARTPTRPRASFATWQISNEAVSRVAAITASAFFGLPGANRSCKATVQGTLRTF